MSRAFKFTSSAETDPLQIIAFWDACAGGIDFGCLCKAFVDRLDATSVMVVDGSAFREESLRRFPESLFAGNQTLYSLLKPGFDGDKGLSFEAAATAKNLFVEEGNGVKVLLGSPDIVNFQAPLAAVRTNPSRLMVCQLCGCGLALTSHFSQANLYALPGQVFMSAAAVRGVRVVLVYVPKGTDAFTQSLLMTSSGIAAADSVCRRLTAARSYSAFCRPRKHRSSPRLHQEVVRDEHCLRRGAPCARPCQV